jgi:hypothetical protein
MRELVKKVTVSEDVISFLCRRKGKSSSAIVIYRGICNIGYGYGREFVFVPKLKVLDRKKIDNKYFMVYDNSYAVPIWIERGIVSILKNRPILITLRKGLVKGLKLETGYKILAKR